ncbi:MAG: cytochrome c biogenesis protein ResB [Syntrophales bacterium]|nr:cytochrome c biogenesis protein ResB [Syntrophales bacterium]MDY0043679.1 cytochrome c biogenesis protein ResB [Syntrophales bacterium]
MMRKIYKYTASVRLTIFLFFTLAATSVFGTLVTQGLPGEHYEKIYGPGMVSFLDFFEITDMYHSWWFMLLLFLLAVNITACTIRTLPGTLRGMSRKNRDLEETVTRLWPIQYVCESAYPVETMEQKLTLLAGRLTGKPTIIREGEERRIYSEGGAYSRLGAPVVHISILLVLAGGLIGSIMGFSGRMTIIEGEMSSIALLFPGDKEEKLPFSVKCDGFAVQFYDNGMPKEYRSDITIIDEGEPVASESIRVNDPFTYRGFKLCQASYGIAEASDFKISVTEEKSATTSICTLNLMKKVPLPGSDKSFAVARFVPDLQGLGPAVMAVILAPGAPHDIFWIPSGLHQAQGTKRQGYTFKIEGFTARYYTGLQVGKDPGVPLVWAGFVLILGGFAMILFKSHRRLWMKITPVSEGSRVEVAAKTDRKDGSSFEKSITQKFNKLCKYD